MIWAVSAAVAFGLIALAWAVNTGRISLDALPQPVHTTPALGLPAHRALAPADLRELRFETALRGYDPRPVEAFLATWSRSVEEGGPGTESISLEDVSFPVVLRGYRMDQVDDVLEALSVRS